MSEHRKVEEGKTYIIDEEFSNGGPVIVVKCYGEHFCRVKNPDTGYEWETMNYRLTGPIEV